MPTSPLKLVIRQLRAATERDEAGRTDGELLTRFLSHRDNDALTALVHRHAPMVWGVCRRLLRSPHDAEDAFQATFLVLVRKAATIMPRQMVGNWLYGVAHQTAVRLRATAAKRGVREMQMMEMPEPVVAEARGNDLLLLLDLELSCLPEKYRVLIVLCDLESKTRIEVARQLAIPEGTVASRLARARGILAKRLARHGLAVSGGSLAAVLSQTVASASVPPAVVSSTIKVVMLVATGQTAATGLVSAKVAALTEGVLKAMLMSKLKAVVAVVLVLGFIVTGATVLSCRTAAAHDDKKPAVEKPVEPAAKQAKEKETFTAWGKEINGLQAGLGFRPGEHRGYRIGETITFVVLVRNVGKKDVKFESLNEFFFENPPTITDGDGKPISLEQPIEFSGIPAALMQENLAPGKGAVLCELDLKLRPASEKGKGRPWQWTLYETGKFQVQFEKVGGNIGKVGAGIGTGEIRFDPILSKLATGKLEIEVKEPEKMPPEKEPFTAWGKEVGGLQAGLGFRPGEKRAYSHGEAVGLVLRVRNVGKEAVEFKHIYAFFLENPPTITDADGKTVELLKLAADGRQLPRSTNVAPGKEVELYEWSFDLQPKGVIKKGLLQIHGTGKFSLQCERIVGPTSGNPNHPNPRLDKLATGKLELEVKAEKPAQKQDEQPVKEGLTAWGKEIGGLQAGLGYFPGEKRAYRQGETVRVVARVRNVGKEAVDFKHIWAFFVENPPKITDADGKMVQLPNYRTRDKGLHMPLSANVAPGKEVELYEWTFDLRPKGENSSRSFIHGTGKFSLQCERIVGPTWLNPQDPNPAMNKLATGKLELEINPKTPKKK
jgi:RNA polymerase sigma factor (sigma-70 family)